MDKLLKLRLKELIAEARLALGAKATSIEVADAAMGVLALEDLERCPMRRDRIALDFICTMAERSQQRARVAQLRANPAQAWLDLPDFQYVPVIAGKDSFEEFNERIAARKRELKSYKRPRLSSQQEQILKWELRDMQRLKPKIAPYFVNEPTMTVERATELYRQSVLSPKPATEQRREAAKRARARKAKLRRT